MNKYYIEAVLDEDVFDELCCFMHGVDIILSTDNPKIIEEMSGKVEEKSNES